MAAGICRKVRSPGTPRIRGCPRLGLLAEEDADIKPRSRHLQGETPADCREQEEPPHDKENDRVEQCREECPGSVPFHVQGS